MRNNIIQGMSHFTINYIMDEISSITFVDVTSRSQLYTVLCCFVHVSKVHEIFSGFTDISADQTSDDLFKAIHFMMRSWNNLLLKKKIYLYIRYNSSLILQFIKYEKFSLFMHEQIT